MRVAIVTTSYPAAPGDPSGHFVQSEVRELQRAGHLVNVIRPAPGGAFGWPGAVTRMVAKPWRSLEAAGWVARSMAHLRVFQPDRVIAHWCVPSGWPIGVSVPADLEIVCHGGDVRFLVAMPKPMRESIVRVLAERVTAFRFVSEPLRDSLAQSVGAKTRAALTRVSVVAPSPLAMNDVAAQALTRRTSVGARPLYVCAARLVADKRIDKVIDYVATLPSHASASKPVLVVVGDGPLRERLERTARRWLIDARFVGVLPRAETLAWIGAADELVHASRAEGLSTVVREAHHLGVKVTHLA